MGNLRFLMLAAVTGVSLAVTTMISGCSTIGNSYYAKSEPNASCEGTLTTVVDRIRSEDTHNEINAEFDWLSSNCSTEYDIATEYASASTSAFGLIGKEACGEWTARGFRTETVDLLREDRLCIENSAPAAEGSAQNPFDDLVPPGAATGLDQTIWPDGGLSWGDAGNYAGTYQRVCGPLVSTRPTEDGIFFNIGRDYPNSDRFALVLWGAWEVDALAVSTTVCASGDVYLYGGVAQMEIYSPDAIEIWQ